jgi:hypothetical protein
MAGQSKSIAEFSKLGQSPTGTGPATPSGQGLEKLPSSRACWRPWRGQRGPQSGSVIGWRSKAVGAQGLARSSSDYSPLLSKGQAAVGNNEFPCQLHCLVPTSLRFITLRLRRVAVMWLCMGGWVGCEGSCGRCSGEVHRRYIGMACGVGWHGATSGSTGAALDQSKRPNWPSA